MEKQTVQVLRPAHTKVKLKELYAHSIDVFKKSILTCFILKMGLTPLPSK
jgi:hypothetical protein